MSQSLLFIPETPLRIRKNLVSTLGSVYGIGKTRGKKLISILGQRLNFPTVDVNKSHNVILQRIFKKLLVHQNLRIHIYSRLCWLKKSINYRYIRRCQGLPLTGRTHGNGKTNKYLLKQNLIFPFSYGYKPKVEKIDRKQKKLLLAKKAKKLPSKKNQKKKGVKKLSNKN